MAAMCPTLPIWLAALTAAVIFFVIWLTVWIRALGWSGPPTFTPNGIDFDPRHGHYMKTAEVVVALASASLLFIPKLRVDTHLRSYSFTMVLLGASVLFCVLFMAGLTYFYENFLYRNDSYSAWKYGLVNALGFSGLLCFAIAYVVLAVAMAKATLAGAVGAP
jgi:hypothetical protein